MRTQTVERLFRSHYNWLCGWLRCKGESHADDVASEVFEHLLRLTYVEELREPRAMMRTIASRIVSQLRRRACLRRAIEAGLADQPVGSVGSPEDQLLVGEALKSIELVLGGLSSHAQAAFLLSHVDGLKNREIAKRLNVSTRTVERYLKDGLRAALSLRKER